MDWFVPRVKLVLSLVIHWSCVIHYIILEGGFLFEFVIAFKIRIVIQEMTSVTPYASLLNCRAKTVHSMYMPMQLHPTHM